MVHSEWLSPEELAEWLGIPVGTIYQWRYRGVGPPGYKLGRHVRYRRSQVESWIEAQGAVEHRVSPRRAAASGEPEASGKVELAGDDHRNGTAPLARGGGVPC